MTSEGLQRCFVLHRRHNIIKGKTKIELPKTVDAAKLTLEEVKAILDKNASKKPTKRRKKKK